jgi:hypothetical protein
VSEQKPTTPATIHPGALDEQGNPVFPQPNLTNHHWRQHGTSVDCDSCMLPHGFTLEPNQILAGVDANGYPVIKSVSD